MTVTGRERILAILNRQPPDRPCWTTLADATTRSIMPAEMRNLAGLDFFRYVGCDIMMFGNWELPPEVQVKYPARIEEPVEWQTNESGGLQIRQARSRWGTLTATFGRGHPVRYPVDSLETLRTLKEIYLHAQVTEDKSREPEESYRRCEAAIGQDGVFFATTDPSPVQHLLELSMGAENFYYLLQDYPGEMEELLAAMHRLRVQEYEILARRLPAPALMPVENTSSTLISPDLYRKYSLPQIRDYCEAAHSHGKKVILHMCGLLKNLLPLVAETGMDGVNALTPPPVGDCTFETALDMLGEDLPIVGGVFPANSFHMPNTMRCNIWDGLDRLYTDRVRRANLLLWVAVDGIPTPMDRLLAVRDWFAAQKPV